MHNVCSFELKTIFATFFYFFGAILVPILVPTVSATRANRNDIYNVPNHQQVVCVYHWVDPTRWEVRVKIGYRFAFLHVMVEHILSVKIGWPCTGIH